MTDRELATFLVEQRAIDAARTQGEWQPRVAYTWDNERQISFAAGAITVINSEPTSPYDEPTTVNIDRADANFITAASANYGKLLSIIEKQRQRIAELERNDDIALVDNAIRSAPMTGHVVDTYIVDTLPGIEED